LVDLSDPDPIEIEQLPGIREDEIDALLEVCGSGPADLAARLASSALDPTRLIEWAPHLTCGRAGSRWSILATARGTTEDVVAAGEALRLESESFGLATSWKRTPRALLGQEHAWISLRSETRGELAAGAIVEHWTGPAPWDDPITATGSTWGESSEFHSVGRPGARGVSIRAGQAHVACWIDPDHGRRFIGRLGGGHWWLFGGSAPARGYGAGLGHQYGSTAITAEVHAPEKRGPVVRLGARGPSARLFLSSSVAGARGLGTARIDARVSAAAGSVRIGAEGSRTQGSTPATRRGVVWISRAGLRAQLRGECRWNGVRAQTVTRAERRCGRWIPFASATFAITRGAAEPETRIGARYSRAGVRAEASVLAGSTTREARLRLSSNGTRASARLAMAWPLDPSDGTFRWELSLGERGG
jgi:hypothetical protein